MFELVLLGSAATVLATLVLAGAGFVDIRPLRFHGAPPAGVMRLGARVTAIGCVWTYRIWWAVFPILVLVFGLVLLAIGETWAAHRTPAGGPSGPADGDRPCPRGTEARVGSEGAEPTRVAVGAPDLRSA
jgi:hypothetical protein